MPANIINLQVLAEPAMARDRANGTYEARLALDDRHYMWQGSEQTIPMGMDNDPEGFAAGLRRAMPLADTLRLPFNLASFNPDGSLHPLYERFLEAAAQQGFRILFVQNEGLAQRSGSGPGWTHETLASHLETEVVPRMTQAWQTLASWLDRHEAVREAVWGYELANELHARPFPALDVPCDAVYLAIKQPIDAANRDRKLDIDHLQDLLTRHASAEAPKDSAHFFGQLGKHALKWESHTEFVTYTAFVKGNSKRPFDPAEAEVFPEDWVAAAPGKRLVSLLIRVEEMPEDENEVLAKLDEWLVGESLAVSRVVDGAAIVAGDFRIDPAGHMRFAVFVRKGTGARRVGRIVQRLCEVETYRSTSMLGLVRARALSQTLNALDPKLSDLVTALDTTTQSPEAALHELLQISSELESLAVKYTFRFGATAAYEAIVNQRIEVMREQRIQGRQSFGEFMMRRYDPAMRTVKSAESRLKSMAERAQRAAELLRTRVDVERSAQNQKLLESMDQRADLQLRLQKTVEGLSVEAISYYAVNLASYALYPLSEALHMSKGLVTAIVTPLVILAVWLGVRRVRKHLD